VFTSQNHERATWITFLIAVLINALYLAYYEVVPSSCTTKGSIRDVVWVNGSIENVPLTSVDDTTSCTVQQLPKDVLRIITTLNSLIVVSSVFTLVMYLVVRIPVIFQEYHFGEGKTLFQSAFATATEYMTVYYFMYVGVVLASLVSHYMASFLLLDIIVKITLARDVLNAVYKPRKQIIMAFFLVVIIVYIFASVTVSLLQ
jgi:hypothetical protein